MKRVDHSFPLPVFTINKNFIIQSYSKEAEDHFVITENFMDLFDEGSLSKLKKWINPEVKKVTLEVQLKPYGNASNPVTCDLHVKWNNDLHAEVLLILKDDQMERVTTMMNQLRARLNDTNFQLLEEKEKLEEALELNNRLSAPFITLTPDTALIPLFGDLSLDKMDVIEEPLLHRVNQGGMERVLLDFTGVGDIPKDGAQALKSLTASLFYMGAAVVITGVRPEQVPKLQQIRFPVDVSYLHSLQQAVSRYCLHYDPSSS
ncbi:STAS domain-containing protein [Halobacillus litoralis]|uniref:STAS domain-containing protein n=1 Tax=Halobacillus litoralis TaxID=45668 RepID=A0A845DWB4_9BACI|nr:MULTISPECIES: STAS domain-containing protein [Halobacillus]MYL21089.1 STAS domain-containing protein [Halobacillus litoralis]MYL31375.1 STAS domain-containing protein [Halobacillus halophilus]MYL38470.1 STAS domain-containing protein [Halobacillus litoralis]